MSGALKVDPAVFEKADIADMRAEKLCQQIFGLWTLHSQWRHIRFAHRDIQTTPQGKTHRIKQNVTVRDGQPEPVLCQFQHDGIVDHASLCIDDRNVKTVADLCAGDIARCHQLYKGSSIQSRNLDLTLAGDIPDLDVGPQVPVILLQRGLERLGQQHVIDDGKAPHTVLFDTVGIRRAADAPRHVQAVHQREVHIE